MSSDRLSVNSAGPAGDSNAIAYKTIQGLKTDEQKMEDKQLFDEKRFIGSTYIPRRGRSNIADRIDVYKSQLLHNVIKPSEASLNKASNEYLNNIKKKDNKMFQSRSQNILKWSHFTAPQQR